MTNTSPILSIIVPIYNVELYLGACLDSIFKCDPSNKEFILVNDGSTDNSMEIVRKYETCINVKIVDKANGGLSDARNAGLKLAKGVYVIFIDSDDFIHADVLDEITRSLTIEMVDIFVANYYEFKDFDIANKRIRTDKTNFISPLRTQEQRLLVLFDISVSFAVWNKIYRRSFLENNSLTFTKGIWFEDLDFIFRAFYVANEVAKFDKMLYAYRQRPNSITKSLDARILHKLHVLRKIKEILEKDNVFVVYEKLYGLLYLKMAFSIFYTCYKGRTDKEKSLGIIHAVFNDKYFYTCFMPGKVAFDRFKLKEKILYGLLKYKIINKKLINWIW